MLLQNTEHATKLHTHIKKIQSGNNTRLKQSRPPTSSSDSICTGNANITIYLLSNENIPKPKAGS